MSKLRSPIREQLRETPPDPETMDRMWTAVRKRTEHRPHRTLFRVTAVATACSLVLLVRGIHPSHGKPGPLTTSEGSAITVLAQAGETTLDDGSHLFLSDGAELKTLENSGERFDVQQRKGKVRFEVEPGGPRRWIIEAGPATVEVVGTQFTVDREEHYTEVNVFKGIVLVRGENVPGNVQRLTVGEHLRVPDAIPPVEVPAPYVVPVPEPLPSPLLSPRVEPRPVSHALPLAPPVVKQEAAPVTADDLMKMADVERRSGHVNEALQILTTVSEKFPTDHNAPLAAYTCGLIEMDQLNHPASAAEAFAQAQSLGLPNALLEDASGRLVEARHRTGDEKGAQAAFQDYVARFPHGQERERLEQLLKAP